MISLVKKPILLVLITSLLSASPAWALGTKKIVCTNLTNNGATATFMDGFCDSLASCEKTLTCQFTAASVSDGTFDKAMKVWSEPGETLQNDMSCWLLANKKISTPLNFANYFLKNCLGSIYTKSYLHQKSFWAEVKDTDPIQKRTFKTPKTNSEYTVPFPIQLKDPSIVIDHPIRADATFGGSASKIKIDGATTPLKAYDDIYILDGDLDPLDPAPNPNKRTWLRPSQAFKDKQHSCALIVQTSQPVIIQNLNIEGFPQGICIYSNSIVILSDVNIYKSSEAIMLHSGKVLVRNSRLEASAWAISNYSDEYGAVVVNSNVLAPSISRNVIPIQDNFSQAPIFKSSNTPSLRIVKASNETAIGKLTFEKSNSGFSTTDTVIIYVQKDATSMFQELKRFTGSDLGQLPDGLLVHGFDISGLSNDALFMAIVVKGSISANITQATHDLWTQMVNQGVVNVSSSFSTPANFNDNISGGSQIVHLCQKGDSANFQFFSADTNTQEEKDVPIKLGEDIKWLQMLSPETSRQKLVLKKYGTEILFNKYPTGLWAYGPWFLLNNEYTWNYMPTKTDSPLKVVLSTDAKDAYFVIANADNPDPCKQSLFNPTGQRLDWNIQGEIEVLLNDPKGSYAIRLQKIGVASASIIPPAWGSIPNIGKLGFSLDGIAIPTTEQGADITPASDQPTASAGSGSSGSSAGDKPEETVPQPKPNLHLPARGGSCSLIRPTL